ncbi:hypothetical protein BDR26DRAFT_860185 [Obelidium mucronatum]|nr:hypothetical protein BDR26DRAFT_860185 [Obelidium mucronatum]
MREELEFTEVSSPLHDRNVHPNHRNEPKLSVFELPVLSLKQKNNASLCGPSYTGSFAASFKHTILPHSMPIDHSKIGWTALPDVIDHRQTQIIGVLTCQGGLLPNLHSIKPTDKKDANKLRDSFVSKDASIPPANCSKRESRTEMLKRAYVGSKKTHHKSSHWESSGILKGVWTSGVGWKQVKEDLKLAANKQFAIDICDEVSNMGVPVKLLETKDLVAINAVMNCLTKGRNTMLATPANLRQTSQQRSILPAILTSESSPQETRTKLGLSIRDFRWKLAIFQTLQRLNTRQNRLHVPHSHKKKLKDMNASPVDNFDRMADFLDSPLPFNIHPPRSKLMLARGNNEHEALNREKEAFIWAMRIKELLDRRSSVVNRKGLDGPVFSRFEEIEELDSLLQKIPWFSQFSEDLRHGICDVVQISHHPRNTVLTKYKNRHQTWYILLTGSISKTTPPQKKVQKLSRLPEHVVQTLYFQPQRRLYQSIKSHLPHVKTSHAISNPNLSELTTSIRYTTPGTSMTPFQNLLDPLAYTCTHPASLKTDTHSWVLSVDRRDFIKVVEEAESGVYKTLKKLSKVQGIGEPGNGVDGVVRRDYLMELVRKGELRKIESGAVFPEGLIQNYHFIILSGSATMQIVSIGRGFRFTSGKIRKPKLSRKLAFEQTVPKMVLFAPETQWNLPEKWRIQSQDFIVRIVAGPSGCVIHTF